MTAPTRRDDGGLPGYSPDFDPKFKSYVTGGRSVSARRPDITKAKKMAGKAGGKK